jgi:hypothetical protein
MILGTQVSNISEHSKIVVYAAQIRNAIVAEMYEPMRIKEKLVYSYLFQPDGSVNSTAKEVMQNCVSHFSDYTSENTRRTR